ncbi:MAG: NTPase [Fidelibacterota bacterium]
MAVNKLNDTCRGYNVRLPYPLIVKVTNLLVTGRPGVGKTTLVERVVKSLNVPVGGFYTREIRDRDRRVGFSLSTWEGRSGIMSHVDFDSSFRVGKYGVNIQVVDNIGVPAIHDAMAVGKLIVIDELGRMELFSEKFQQAVAEALDSEVPLLGAIQERPHPFLDKIRQRPDVELISITLENRDALVRDLGERLGVKG